MGDLACDSERVTMEGSTHSSFICEDDPVLLEEALPPAGQTLCSAHHFRFSQLRNKERQRKWWELPGSLEPKESSTYEPSPSFLVKQSRLVFLPDVVELVHISWDFMIRWPSSPDDFSVLETELVDYDIVGSQESEHGSSFVHEMLDEAMSSRQTSYSPRTSFRAAEAFMKWRYEGGLFL